MKNQIKLISKHTMQRRNHTKTRKVAKVPIATEPSSKNQLTKSKLKEDPRTLKVKKIDTGTTSSTVKLAPLSFETESNMSLRPREDLTATLVVPA